MFELLVKGTENGTDNGEGAEANADLSGTFYLAIALSGDDLPEGGSLGDIGELVVIVRGATYIFDASDFNYGTPPKIATTNQHLGDHDVYDAW